MLEVFHKDDTYIIGVDEVGRGPLFGRVYAAAVILPHLGFKHDLMKDSKKFTSSKKIKEIADYIKENCIAYSIMYQDEKSIDKHNILINAKWHRICFTPSLLLNKSEVDYILESVIKEFKNLNNN